MVEVTKSEVKNFWEINSCGKKFVDAEVGTKEFFNELERHRYKLESHILDLIPFATFKGKKVLEIGCGLGTDAVQFARNGALYQGVDLTSSAVQLTKRRFEFEGLPGDFMVNDAENLPFEAGTFDCVYSHGVIHHTPDIEKAASEIYRVLKSGGTAIIMVYHRNSFNYYLNIRFLRTIGIWLLLLPGGTKFVSKLTGETIEGLQKHKQDFKQFGLKYLSSQIFLSRNTDGAGNPLSRVYSAQELKKLFSAFPEKKTCVRYLNTHRIPVLRKILPRKLESWFASKFGWHIYIFATK